MFESILIALDGSEHDRTALTAAKELAKLAEAPVRVVHVREGDFIGARDSSPARRRTRHRSSWTPPSPSLSQAVPKRQGHFDPLCPTLSPSRSSRRQRTHVPL